MLTFGAEKRNYYVIYAYEKEYSSWITDVLHMH